MHFTGMKKKIKGLLVWSEKYTKTDMVYVTKGGGWLGSSQIISLVSGMFLTIGFANLIPLTVYGIYKYILTLRGTINIFSLTGMGTATLQASAQGYEGSLKKNFWTDLKWRIGTILIALGGAGYYFIQGNTVLGSGLVLIAITAPITTSASLYAPFLSGKKLFHVKAVYSGIHGILSTAILLTTLFLTDSVIILFLTYVLANLIITAILYFRTKKKYVQNSRVNKYTSGYAKHLSLMNIIGEVALKLDKILIFHYLGAAQLAIYSFAFAPPKQLESLNKILKTLAFPKLSNTDITHLKKAIPYKAMQLFFLALGIVITYSIAAPYIFEIFFPQYMGAVLYSQVLSLNLLFFPRMLYNQTLLAHMKKKQLYITKTIPAILRIFLLIILLPLYHIWGVIIAILFAQLVKFFLVYILFKRL